jgi:hypothetical protein
VKLLTALALTLVCLGATSAQAATPTTYYWTTRQATNRAPAFEGCMGTAPYLNTIPRRYRNFMCVKRNFVIDTLWYVVYPMKVTGPRTYTLGMGARTTEAYYLKILLKWRTG